MNTRETLERRIDELCRENEQLRQQVASIIGRSIRTADKLDCLETENAKLRGARDVWQENDAKLRELVRDIYVSAYYEYPSYFESKFAARMRELGIEVPS